MKFHYLLILLLLTMSTITSRKIKNTHKLHRRSQAKTKDDCYKRAVEYNKEEHMQVAEVMYVVSTPSDPNDTWHAKIYVKAHAMDQPNNFCYYYFDLMGSL